MPSSARLHDLKFTFTPAGADDSVHSKAPLPRGGCLRSAQTGRVFEPILFFLFQKEKNGFNLPRRERVLCKTGSANRTAIASEEASSIPFPPGRRKLHIRSLLLPSQIVTVSLGHNLAIWNFTTPHAILRMAGRRHLADTFCRGGRLCPPESVDFAVQLHQKAMRRDLSGGRVWRNGQLMAEIF